MQAATFGIILDININNSEIHNEVCNTTIHFRPLNFHFNYCLLVFCLNSFQKFKNFRYAIIMRDLNGRLEKHFKLLMTSKTLHLGRTPSTTFK